MVQTYSFTHLERSNLGCLCLFHKAYSSGLLSKFSKYHQMMKKINKTMQFISSRLVAVFFSTMYSLLWVLLSISIGVVSQPQIDIPIQPLDIWNMVKQSLFITWFFYPLLFFLFYDAFISVSSIRPYLTNIKILPSIKLIIFLTGLCLAIFSAKKFLNIDEFTDEISILLIALFFLIKFTDYLLSAIDKQNFDGKGYMVKTLP